jgi:hypothetical protein
MRSVTIRFAFTAHLHCLQFLSRLKTQIQFSIYNRNTISYPFYHFSFWRTDNFIYTAGSRHISGAYFTASHSRGQGVRFQVRFLLKWQWGRYHPSSSVSSTNSHSATRSTFIKHPIIDAILCQINPVHTTPSYLSKMRLNITLTPMSRSSQWSLSFWISHQYPICSRLRPHACCMPCPSHPPSLGHSNYTWRRVQVMKVLIV